MSAKQQSKIEAKSQDRHRGTSHIVHQMTRTRDWNTILLAPFDVM